MAIEVDVLHAEGESFLYAEPGAVEDLAEETEGRLKPVEQREDVAAREDVGEVVGAVRAFEAFEGGHLDLEYLAVEEDQRAEALVLRGRRAASADREVVEECGELGGAHLARVTPVVEADELADPVEVRLLGARRVVESADRGGDGFEEGHGGAPGGARKKAARGLIGGGAGRLPRAGRAVREIGSGCIAAPFMGICSGDTTDCDVGQPQGVRAVTHDKNVSPVGWYLASYLLRFVELSDEKRDDPEERFLSWENTILVKAKSLDEAYVKASKVARQETKPYRGGSEGVRVKWEFEGITELLPIYEALGDGSEIAWAKHRPRKLKTLRTLVRPKGSFHQ